MNLVLFAWYELLVNVSSAPASANFDIMMRSTVGRIAKTAGIVSVLLFANQKLKKSKAFAESTKSVRLPANGPPDLVLKNVQIFIRHGARTPLRVLPYLEQVDSEDYELHCTFFGF